MNLKDVKPDWSTWHGNLWPRECGAITDGFSLFVERHADPKRYARLAERKSYMFDTFPGLELDVTGAVSLDLVSVEEYLHGRKKAHVAVLRGPGVEVAVRAERLRCAMLVTQHHDLWYGSDGNIYLCKKPDLFDVTQTISGVLATCPRHALD